MPIKSNKNDVDQDKQAELFERWRRLGLDICNSANIVQNNLNEFPVTAEQFAEWNHRVIGLANEMVVLRADTFTFVQQIFPPEASPLDNF